MGLDFVPKHVAVREVRLVYEGRSCTFRGDPVLRITRRDEFDTWLVREAEAAGVVVRQGEALVALEQRDEFVELTTSRGVLRARTVVAADGSNSTVRRLLGLRDASHVARLLEVLTPEAPQAPAFRDGVAVFEYGRVGTSLAGYVWDFPSLIHGKAVMNRGIYDGLERTRAGHPGLVDDLEAALRTRGHRLDGLQLQGHPIRTFNPRGPLSVEGSSSRGMLPESTPSWARASPSRSRTARWRQRRFLRPSRRDASTLPTTRAGSGVTRCSVSCRRERNWRSSASG